MYLSVIYEIQVLSCIETASYELLALQLGVAKWEFKSNTSYY